MSSSLVPPRRALGAAPRHPPSPSPSPFRVIRATATSPEKDGGGGERRKSPANANANANGEPRSRFVVDMDVNNKDVDVSSGTPRPPGDGKGDPQDTSPRPDWLPPVIWNNREDIITIAGVRWCYFFRGVPWDGICSYVVRRSRDWVVVMTGRWW